MMHQYIGARYVPIFYVNSQNPDSPEWENNVEYEPLVWVSLPNGNMYLSKKTVPASIGSPASNPNYWMTAGQFNGYIQSLQDQINDMQDGTLPGSLQNQINDNTSDITALTNNKADKNVVNQLSDRVTIHDALISTNANNLGSLASLNTSNKNSAVAAINEVNNNVTNESTARAGADSLLQTQINQIVAPSGSAPNPAEVVDARIGWNGVTYSSLGDSIRTQIEDVKNTFEYSPFTFEISPQYSNRLISNVIECPNKLSIKQTDALYELHLTTFDKDMQFIREEPGSWTTSYTFTKKAETAYMQLIMRHANNSAYTSNTEGVSSLIVNYEADYPYISKNAIITSLDFERGSLDAASGRLSSTTRVRTKNVMHIKAGSAFYVPTGYKLGYVDFNEFGEPTYDSPWLTSGWYTTQSDSYKMFVLAKTDNSEVDIDIANVFKFYLIQPTESDMDLTVISLPLIGDCMLIQFKTSNKNMLVDLGRNADYPVIKNKLKSMGVRKLDYLMISHYHDDHITAQSLSSLISDFNLSSCMVLLPPIVPDSYVGNQWTTGAWVRSVQNAIITILNTNNISYKTDYYPKGHFNMFLGGVQFNLYNYDQDEFFAAEYDYNEMSLVGLFENGNVSILLTGDMMKRLESKMKDILDKTITIAKFGHHGFDGLSNMDVDFWLKIKPEIIFSSSPSDMETYGTNYANSGQIRLANYNNIKNIMTGISGDLHFKINKDSYSVNGCNYKLDNLIMSEFATYNGFSS